MNDKSETLHFSEYMKRTYRSMAEELENELREFEEMKKSSPSFAETLANLNPKLKNL